MTLFLFMLAIVALMFVFRLYALYQVSKLRRSGLYPPLGKACMADVERLLSNDLPVFAIRCYREIHHCSLREAKQAVQEIKMGQK